MNNKPSKRKQITIPWDVYARLEGKGNLNRYILVAIEEKLSREKQA